MGSTLGVVGVVYREQDKYEQAESCLQQGLSIYQQVFGDDHVYTQQAMIRLGVLYREQGEYGRAEFLLRQVLNSQNRELNTPSNAIYGETALKALAVLYYRQGKLEQAEPLLHRALTDLQSELDVHIRAHEQWPVFFSEVVECLNTLALLYQDQGKYEVAEHYHQRALVLLQQGWSSDDIFKVKREREIQMFEARAEGMNAKGGELLSGTDDL
jgi:tetratricopeptide (TPR) repeat protein